MADVFRGLGNTSYKNTYGLGAENVTDSTGELRNFPFDRPWDFVTVFDFLSVSFQILAALFKNLQISRIRPWFRMIDILTPRQLHKSEIILQYELFLLYEQIKFSLIFFYNFILFITF